jgi:hypothetical protein
MLIKRYYFYVFQQTYLLDFKPAAQLCERHRQRQRLSKLSPGATFFARLKLVQRRDVN